MSYSSEVLADSPVLYWRLGEASGTTVTDSSGAGISGTYSGSPALGVTGLVGDSDTAVQFTTAGNQAARSGATIWSGASNASIEIWIKASAPPSVPGRILTSSGIGTTIIFQTELAGTLTVTTTVDGGSGATTMSGITGVLDGNPHHLVWTYSDSANTVLFYVDGVQVRSATRAGNLARSTSISVSTTNTSINFVGVADELAMYATTLSPTRIAAHYAAGSPAVNATSAGTVAISGASSSSARPTATGAVTISGSSASTASPTAVGTVSILGRASRTANITISARIVTPDRDADILRPRRVARPLPQPKTARIEAR